MNRLLKIKPKFVEIIPDELEEGILYISLLYKVAIHLCACGCKEQVVTPLEENWWDLTIKGDKVSLTPSIGNFNQPCKTHYYIKNNEIEWLLKKRRKNEI